MKKIWKRGKERKGRENTAKEFAMRNKSGEGRMRKRREEECEGIERI